MKNINLQTAWNQIQPPDGLKEDILQKLQEAIRKEQTSTESVGDAPRPAPAAARWRIALGLAAAAAVLLVATLAWPPVLPASQPDPTVPAVATKSSSVRQDPPDESAAAQTDASQTEAQALAESLPLLDASSILQDKEGGDPADLGLFGSDNEHLAGCRSAGSAAGLSKSVGCAAAAFKILFEREIAGRADPLGRAL